MKETLLLCRRKAAWWVLTLLFAVAGMMLPTHHAVAASPATTTQQTPTPGVLETFIVAFSPQGALLLWSTAHEEQVVGFYMQRQGTDVTWKRISEFIPATGGELSYFFADPQPPSNARYRLEVVYDDQSSDYHLPTNQPPVRADS
jgi:hypothetical protein